MGLDKSKWPRGLLWHGWLPGLSCSGDRAPWDACLQLEGHLGACPVGSSSYCTPPEFWDAGGVALEMSDHPNNWTDGSGEDFSSVGGSRLRALGFICLLRRLPLKVLSGC